MARSRQVGSDGTTLTYHLDTSRRWSDGQPIRGADVAFTYGLLADPELGLPLSSTTERLDSVSVVDDSTVTFYFDRLYPGMLFDTGVGIIPEHVYGDLLAEELQGLPRYQEAGDESFVVSGPFGLESWAPNDRIVLVRNPASGADPLLDRVVVRVVPEETTRRTERLTWCVRPTLKQKEWTGGSGTCPTVFALRTPGRHSSILSSRTLCGPSIDSPRGWQSLCGRSCSCLAGWGGRRL